MWPVTAFRVIGKPHADTSTCWYGARAIPVMLALTVLISFEAQSIEIVRSTIRVEGLMTAIIGRLVPSIPGTVSRKRPRPASQRGCSSPPEFGKDRGTPTTPYGGSALMNVAYGAIGACPAAFERGE